jgi:hypothetical protein
MTDQPSHMHLQRKFIFSTNQNKSKTVELRSSWWQTNLMNLRINYSDRGTAILWIISIVISLPMKLLQNHQMTEYMYIKYKSRSVYSFITSLIMLNTFKKITIFWDIMPCSASKIPAWKQVASWELRTGLPPAFALVFCSVYLTLNMDVICSSETMVDCQCTTWRYIPEDSNSS